MTKLWPFVASLFILMMALQVGAQTSMPTDFADHLYTSEDYYRAITEYKRAIFTHSADQRTREYGTFMVGKTLFDGSEFDRAATWFLDQQDILEASEFKSPYRRLTCLSLLETHDVFRMQEVLLTFGVPEAPFFGAFTHALERNWDKAQHLFSTVPESNPYSEQAQFNRHISQRAHAFNWKNPTTAGLLAIIPGAGYMYSGHKGSALTALLINSTFIYATVESFESDNYVLGGLLSLFSVSWYRGNITGSIGSARRYNTHYNNQFLDELLH